MFIQSYLRTAQCSCISGLGETCSHVAGLLFKIEAAVCIEHMKTGCTDEACQRNINFEKKVELL